MERAASVCVHLELPWNPAVFEQHLAVTLRERPGVVGQHPGGDRPEVPGEVLALHIPLPGEGVHIPTLLDCDLGQDVGRRAEPVQPDPLHRRRRLQRHAIGTVPDQPRAQERSQSPMTRA